MEPFKLARTYSVLAPRSLPCQSNLSSMTGPKFLPLKVLQRMAVGLFSSLRAFLSAAIIYGN